MMRGNYLNNAACQNNMKNKAMINWSPEVHTLGCEIASDLNVAGVKR